MEIDDIKENKESHLPEEEYNSLRKFCNIWVIFMLTMILIIDACSVISVSKSECREMIRFNTDTQFLIVFVLLSNISMLFVYLLRRSCTQDESGSCFTFIGSILMIIIMGSMSCVVLYFYDIRQDFYSCNVMFKSCVGGAVIYLILFCVTVLFELYERCNKLKC